MGDAALATFFALVTAISWGFSDFFGAKASKVIGATVAAYYANFIGLAFFTPIYFFFLEPGGSLWSSGGAFAALGGAVLVTAVIIFFKALVAGPVSAVAPIAAAYPLFTMLVALAFGASLSGLQAVAIGLVVVGIMATSGLFTLKKSERHIGRGPLLAIIAATIYGVGFAFVAQGVERIGWQTASMAQLSAAVIFLLLLLPFLNERREVIAKYKLGFTNKFVAGNAIIGGLGMVTLNVAFVYDQTSGAVVSAISACYPVLTIFLALKHFREEIKVIPLIGAAASIFGIVLLSL